MARVLRGGVVYGVAVNGRLARSRTVSSGTAREDVLAFGEAMNIEQAFVSVRSGDRLRSAAPVLNYVHGGSTMSLHSTIRFGSNISVRFWMG